MSKLDDLIIRAMKPKDLAAITAIDTKVLGRSRPDYWQMKMELLESRSPMASLVAEVGGKVVGFILGDASGWEYGIPETVAYIDTLGVDPDYQARSVGRMLVAEMIDHFRKVGVQTIYTYVNWHDGSLLSFFDKVGFKRGDMINLEMKI
ncbi:MAG: GNAT family N-acetyltransferase [Deltaproteobacteria bacterium]|nr:GNAT family N-acetyltransferase [Deltaproteobacteria bacterium]